jgi:hypothetical protein
LSSSANFENTPKSTIFDHFWPLFETLKNSSFLTPFWHILKHEKNKFYNTQQWKKSASTTWFFTLGQRNFFTDPLPTWGNFRWKSLRSTSKFRPARTK